MLSKIGTDNFNLNEFNTMCTEFASKLVGLAQLIRNDFAKCANQNVMEIVDFAVDFFKDLLFNQCSYNEEQLSGESNQKVFFCVMQKLLLANFKSIHSFKYLIIVLLCEISISYNTFT